MGGTDVGLSASVASSATSGLQGNFSRIFGDKIVGGAKKNPWLLAAGLGVAFILGLVWITRH